MRFVLDNSVAMRWLFGDGGADDLAYAAHVLSLLEQEDTQAVVPSIWGLEAANVIVRAETKGLLTEARSVGFLEVLQDMAIETDPATANHALADTLHLARRFNLSSYDAAYLELALRQSLALATLDTALRAAAVRAGVALA
jgi:predicted nucleic acid-binding protein